MHNSWKPSICSDIPRRTGKAPPPIARSAHGGRQSRRETILEQNKAKRSRGGLFFAIQAGIWNRRSDKQKHNNRCAACRAGNGRARHVHHTGMGTAIYRLRLCQHGRRVLPYRPHADDGGNKLYSYANKGRHGCGSSIPCGCDMRLSSAILHHNRYGCQ